MARTRLKWLHWLAVALRIYFFFNEPEGVRQMGAAALSFHAGMGLLLGIIAALWFISYMRKGLVGRPGPKLPGWGRVAHVWGHRLLMYILPGVVLSGALAGVGAPYVIYAFDVIPINPGIGNRDLHDMLNEIHELAFNITLFFGLAHGAFHLWRHLWLRDNALRLILPKAMHRWL